MHRSQATEFGDHGGVRLGWLRTLTCGAKNSYSRRMECIMRVSLSGSARRHALVGREPPCKGGAMKQTSIIKLFMGGHLWSALLSALFPQIRG